MDFEKICSNIGPLGSLLLQFVSVKLLKIFLSETVFLGAYIFCMLHCLVDLYQYCPNYVPWVKIGWHLGGSYSKLCFLNSRTTAKVLRQATQCQYGPPVIYLLLMTESKMGQDKEQTFRPIRVVTLETFLLVFWL